MDPNFRDNLALMNGVRIQPNNDHALSLYSNYDYMNKLPNLGNGLVETHSNLNFGDVNYMPYDTTSANLSSMSIGSTHLEGFHEEYDFSDSVLSYINQILVEEDVEGKGCMPQESLEHLSLQNEVMGKAYPVEYNLGTNLDYLKPMPSYICPNVENSNRCFPNMSYRSLSANGKGNSSVGDPSWRYGVVRFGGSEVMDSVPCSRNFVSSYSPVSVKNGMGGFVDSPIKTLRSPDMRDESQSISQFMKGVEEANKFLPSDSELILSVDPKGLGKTLEESLKKSEKQDQKFDVSPELNEDADDIKNGCHSKKHSLGHSVEIGEERSTKLAATSDDSDVGSDMFDKVLLHHARDENELIVSLRTSLRMAAAKKMEQNGQLTASGATRGRRKKGAGKKEVTDLITLLTTCAQAVAANDHRTANELLKKIRQNSSPLGDGIQRLAHYVAGGLEARLSGTGSQIYKGLTSTRTSAAYVLKAYLLYLAACPFRKLSNFFSNKNIAKRTRKAAKIHIIDFGILYGFQWPTFIQRQSMREGGPPKIKITGIDFPQPGFRPAERLEETGLRLENYAHKFKVPFEYHAISKRWDTIQLEEFDIEEDEVLIVNCMYRMKNLPDETVSIESSRNNVLEVIRKLNPDLFVHGVASGSYNAPFFLTRFREALFHFSAQFDMLETIVPRNYGERTLIERDLLAREALNVIACEGWERIERPETYKQWQNRTTRAGFTQLPLDAEIKDRAMTQVRTCYHKDFVIYEDSRWLLLGWKGRITFALTTWKPT